MVPRVPSNILRAVNSRRRGVIGGAATFYEDGSVRLPGGRVYDPDTKKVRKRRKPKRIRYGY